MNEKQSGGEPVGRDRWVPSADVVAEMTGGHSYRTNVNDLEDTCEKIALEMKNQYVIGYKSTNEAKDGKWRKLRLKVNPPKGLPRLSVRAKSGYYAPLADAASTGKN